MQADEVIKYISTDTCISYSTFFAAYVNLVSNV